MWDELHGKLETVAAAVPNASVYLDNRPVKFHLTMCFRATAGALVSQALVSQVRRARATASARALDRATVKLPWSTSALKRMRKNKDKA